MALSEEFKEERDKVKHGPLPQRIAYFWDYYKWHTIISIAVVVGLVSFIYNLVTKTDPVLSGILLNSYSKDAEVVNTLIDEFIELREIDTSEYHVSFNTGLSYSTEGDGTSAQLNYSTDQVITARHMADDLDFLTGDLTTMVEYAYRGLFGDLRDSLTEEQLVFYEPYLLYIDYAVIEERQRAAENFEDTDSIVYPDCHNPEEMQEPVPVMIDVSSCERLTDIYEYEELSASLTFGICMNVVNKENTVIFLDYVMGNVNETQSTLPEGTPE